MEEREFTPLVSGKNSLNVKKKPSNVTFVLVFTCFVISLGSYQHGFNLGVTNTPEEAISGKSNTTLCQSESFFKPCIPMDTLSYSIFASVYVLGALAFSTISGPISDFIGRRTTLFLSNIFFIVGSLMLSLFSNFYILVLGRFIIGLGAGFTSVVVPIYLAEIAPSDYRGTITALHQFMIVFALLFANILGIPLSSRPGWRFLLGFPLVISLIQLVLLPFCPMSPRWLISKGKQEDAINSLKRLRGVEDVEEELDCLQPKETQLKSWTRVFRIQLIKPFIIGILLHIGQQFSGNNAVVFYSTNIFKEAGMSNAALVTVVVGVIKLIFTLVAMYVVESFGRKKLLMSSQVICVISYICLTVSYILKTYKIGKTFMSYISVISIISYVIGYAIGLGPIPWVLLSEIYPSDVRGFLQGFITMVNWLSSFIVAQTFPILLKFLQQYTFLPFIFLLSFNLIFTIFWVPETKGKSIEELTKDL